MATSVSDSSLQARKTEAFAFVDAVHERITISGARCVYRSGVENDPRLRRKDKVCITGAPVFERSFFRDMSNLLDALPLRQCKPLRISTDLPLFTGYPSDSSSNSPAPTNQSITSSARTPSPQCFFHVLCMHDFESSDPDHLPFHKDEVLTIIKQEHSGWWAAMRPQGDRSGWIPGSFVLPLDRRKIVECPNEAPWPYESLNDPPLSADHDPWVPVSEDYRVLSFQLVTPTDLVLYNGLFDHREWSHNCEPIFNLSNDERSPDVGEISVPPTPESPPPRRTQRSYLPQSPVRSEPASSFTASPPCEVDDQKPLHCLTTPVSSDEIAPDLVSSLDIQDWLIALKSVAISQEGTHFDDGTQGHSPASLRLACPDLGIPDSINLLDLTIWGPDNLAEQFCVLIHTLYATIRQRDCLDWMAGRRSADVTGLQQFFDIHDHIASWVQKSVLAYNDMTQQTAALDFWIRVAEKCQALRNFDSLCAIILALSGSSLSSLGSAWARCTRKQTFVTLRNMLDVSNKFCRLINIMDLAEGPSVPFMRRYLDRIKELHVECSSDLPCPSGYATDVGSSAVCRMQLVAVSDMLRHQSSPYNFKTTKSVGA